MVIYVEACESGSMFKNLLPEDINGKLHNRGFQGQMNPPAFIKCDIIIVRIHLLPTLAVWLFCAEAANLQIICKLLVNFQVTFNMSLIQITFQMDLQA